MTINLDRVFANLDDGEQILVELEAEERGVDINTVVFEILCDGLTSEDMDEVFQATDRQWKSH